MPRDGSGVFSPPAGTTATAGTPIESAKYNAFVNDLVTDANTARPIVAGGTGATTAGAALAALGGQPLDAGLTSIAGLTTAADRMIYTTAADTYAVATLTAAGRALLDDADAAAQLVTLGAQAADATLTSLSGLTLAEGDILYATGADTLARLPKGTARQSLAMNAGATAPEWVAAGGWTEMAVVASTSGTSIDFTSIPSGVNDIEIWFDGVSYTGTDYMLIQLGTGGSPTTTGYTADVLVNGAVLSPTAGFPVFQNTAVRTINGKYVFHRMSSNVWIGAFAGAVTTSGAAGGGRISLGGTLDLVRVTSSLGVQTFDAGQLKVRYR